MSRQTYEGNRSCQLVAANNGFQGCESQYLVNVDSRNSVNDIKV